ncbi:unnamed protein product [Euphydryas editha]|uniref:Uncharacterized protein n=1 Tax=Euphydryas editha TaxID=104508 RepID=A0AAU9TVV8_EUPED|nr:unnamed protein product [Euphydryas editha]
MLKYCYKSSCTDILRLCSTIVFVEASIAGEPANYVVIVIGVVSTGVCVSSDHHYCMRHDVVYLKPLSLALDNNKIL